VETFGEIECHSEESARGAIAASTI
jgi:hypothetical protein